MKSDFDLIIRSFPERVRIIPVSDVHLGALEHDAKAWTAFIASVLKDPNTYIILGGDLINNSVRNSVANPFDEIIRPADQKRLMVECLEPIRDRILCSVCGNHEYRTTKDSDQDLSYDIMAKLDLEDIYRPNTAFMKIVVGYNAYTFCVTHGAGGGIYTGATVNRNERFGNIIDGLDCLVVGHTHKGTITKPQKISIDSQNNVVRVKPYTVVSMESWLNYGGYAMRKMLLPAESSSPQTLILSPQNNKKRIEVLW